MVGKVRRGLTGWGPLGGRSRSRGSYMGKSPRNQFRSDVGESLLTAQNLAYISLAPPQTAISLHVVR